MLAWYAPYEGPVVNPAPPPANTPIGAFGANCAASFFIPPPDSPTSFGQAPAAAPPAPANGPPLEIFVTVMVDEDDGDRTPADISLREAILMANAGNADAVIHVPVGTYTINRPGRGENTGGIGDLDISNPGHNTRIVGAGRESTIIRNGVDDRVFHVHSGSTADIRSLAIADGIEPNGAGILNGGILTLLDVVVRGNFANSTGGGIANMTSASLTINQSEIVENASQYGGGIINNINASLTISSSNIASNFGLSGGGILNQGGAVAISNSTISQNNASESGGGIVNLSVVTPAVTTLTNTSVTENRVTNLFQPASLAQGGGICNAAEGAVAYAMVTMSGGEVSNNRVTAGNPEQVLDAAAQGGGVFNRASGGTANAVVNLETTTLNGNLASSMALITSAANGGAAFNRAESGQATATFSISNANANGNAVSAQVVGGEEFADQSSSAQGGAFFNRARANDAVATLTTASTNIEGNSAISTAEFVANVFAEGGALYNVAGINSATNPTTKANVVVSGGVFRGNVVEAHNGLESNARGGAIANFGDFGHTAVDINDVHITQSRASADSEGLPVVHGGAIFNRTSLLSTLSRLSMLRSTLHDNQLLALGAENPLPRGGGLFTEGVNVTVRDSTISANDVSGLGEGGAVFARQTIAVINSTFSGNKAGIGGGMYVQTGAASLSNATVAMNVVQIDGGGVTAELGTSVLLKNSLVARNIREIEGSNPDAQDDLLGDFVATSAYNWIGNGTGATGIVDGVDGNHVGNDTDTLDPLIGPLSNNGGPTQTHLLYPTSPLIDNGEPSFNPADFNPALSLDQRREDRVLDANRDSVARVDIGAVEARSTLLGDLNGDGRVSLVDLMTLQRHFQIDGTFTYAEGDLNGDTLVNQADLAIFVDQFGSSLIPIAPSPAAPAAVVSQTGIANTPLRAPRIRAIARHPHVAAPAGRSPLPREAVDRAMESDTSLLSSLRGGRRRLLAARR